MTSETPHLFKRGVVAGVVLAIAATAAIASFFGSQTVADYLGTGGKTFETWGGPGAGANGVDLQHLTINAHKNPSGGISGTVTLTADNSLSDLAIQRVRCEVRDPTVTGTWTVLSDVTAPDSRISNSAPLNQFSDTFTFSDMTSGIEYRISIWDNAALPTPRYVYSSGYTHP